VIPGPELTALLDGRRLLIFDFDGTIADSSPLHEAAFKAVLEPLGIAVDYPRLAGRSTRDAVRLCFELSGRPAPDAALVEEPAGAKQSPGREVSGAHLAAMLMAAVWPAFAPDLPADLVKAGILLSGIYDLAPVLHAEFVNVDLKLTADDVGLLSPAGMPQASRAPFITAAGGLESDEFKRQTVLIGSRWQQNHCAEILLPAANHLTICDALATPGQPLCEATRQLLADLR